MAKNLLKKRSASGLLPLDLNLFAMNYLSNHGYQFIGLDHFARAEDDLAVAYNNGALHRNFQGMTSGKDTQIIGFGPSSISAFGSFYFQNPHKQKDWLDALDNREFEYRSHRKNNDDQVRYAVIQQIYNYGTIDIQDIEDQFNIDWNEYFKTSNERLKDLSNDGVVQVNDYMIKEDGTLGRLRRVITSAFDHYLPDNALKQGTPGRASQVG